jgi:hypothetical protein
MDFILTQPVTVLDIITIAIVLHFLGSILRSAIGKTIGNREAKTLNLKALQFDGTRFYKR